MAISLPSLFAFSPVCIAYKGFAWNIASKRSEGGNSFDSSKIALIALVQ
jgi:hypothetical protein